jgi:hypothetical protein
MRSIFDSRLVSLLTLSIILSPIDPGVAQENDPGAPRSSSGLSVWISSGVGGSPLGEIAERYSTFAIPGRGRDIRLGLRSGDRREWQVGYSGDRFRLGDQNRPERGRRIEYVSHGVSVGFLRLDSIGAVRMVGGAELGVSRFRVSGADFSRFSGEREESETDGTILILGATAGIELPRVRGITAVPHVRWALNFPDFGGGDGYSSLHRETDLGIKTFFNLAFRISP